MISESMMESKHRKSKFKELTEKLSTDKLLRRLKSVALELSNVDQDDHDEDLDSLAASLVTPFIMLHKDKDVLAIASGCLADILRIYAPDPPYNEDQLKEIFTLIVKQLKYLENPENQMYKRAFYLLESLALVKSFNICFDLDAQEIITDLFKLFFSIVNPKHNGKVRNFMIDVMAPVIQESETLPQEVLEIMLTHCLPSKKKSNEVGYQMAASLIDKTSSALEPYVQLFFNNALVLEKGMESQLVDHLYDLIFELYSINRSVLLSVLPQLEFKLKRNDEQERLEVVNLLGRMFADESLQLAEQHRPLWMCFLGRCHDISVDVRVEFVERVKTILLSNPDLATDIMDHLHERFLDPDERVRQKVVVSVCEVASERIDLLPKKVFDALQERMRDKKWMVRKEALTCAGKLYRRLTSGEKLKAATLKKISWVPNRLLHAYFQNMIEDKICVERIIHGCLVPVTLEDEERMKKLLSIYSCIDDHALCAFDGMIRYRGSINTKIQNLLDGIAQETQEEQEKMVSSWVTVLAMCLPEPFKAQVHLKKFVTMLNDRQLFLALKTSINIENGCAQVMKGMADVVKRLTAKNPIIDSVKALLDRGCHMMIDAGSLVKLIKLIVATIDGFDEEEEEEKPKKGGKEPSLPHKAKRGLLLLKWLASIIPVIFKSKECFEQLLILIKHQEDFVVETALRTLSFVADGLQDMDKSVSSCFQPVLSKLASEGSVKKAKYAVRSLVKMLKDPTNALQRLFNSIADNLSFDSPNLLTHLASLGEIAELVPEIFEARHKYVIREIIVKEIMVQDRENTSDSQESDDEWCEKRSISSETQVKIQCIKVMTKWLLGLKSGFQNSAMPVYRLLQTILKHDGDLNGNGQVSAKNRSHLRLNAAFAFIKLAQISHYWSLLTPEQYRQIALTMQDSCYEVRQKFSLKLHRALDTLKLPLEYLAIFCLSAVDPAKDRRQEVKRMIARNAQTRREYMKQNYLVQAQPSLILPEYVLPFVIHLLAHHPDFDHKNLDALKETKEYLWFFLETIMGPKAENHAFLKKLAENIKLTVDSEDPTNESLNEKIYTVCDLTVWLIMNKTHTVGLKDFPGNPVIPKKLFTPNPDKKATNKKIYLPKEFGGISVPKKKMVPLDIKIQPPLKFQTSTPFPQNGKEKTSQGVPDEQTTTPIRSKQQDEKQEIQKSPTSRVTAVASDSLNLSNEAAESDITFSPTLKKSVQYADTDQHAHQMLPGGNKKMSSSSVDDEIVKVKPSEKTKPNESASKSSGRKRHLQVEQEHFEGNSKTAKMPRKEVSQQQERKKTAQKKSPVKTPSKQISKSPRKGAKSGASPSKGIKPSLKGKESPAKQKAKSPAKQKAKSPAKQKAKSPAVKTPTKSPAKGRGKSINKSPGKLPAKSPGVKASKISKATEKAQTKTSVKSTMKSPGKKGSPKSPGKSPAKGRPGRKAAESTKSPTKQTVKRKLNDNPGASSPTKKKGTQEPKASIAEKAVTIGGEKSPTKRATKGSPSPRKRLKSDKGDDAKSPVKQQSKVGTPKSEQPKLAVKRSRAKRR